MMLRGYDERSAHNAAGRRDDASEAEKMPALLGVRQQPSWGTKLLWSIRHTTLLGGHIRHTVHDALHATAKRRRRLRYRKRPPPIRRTSPSGFPS